LKQIKDASREETVQPSSERVVDGGDTTPPKIVSNGDGDGDREDLENMDVHLSKQNVADTERDEIGDGDPDTELAKEFGNMDPDLSKENVEDADRIHDDDWNDGLGGNEINNDKKNSFGKQSAGGGQPQGGQRPAERLPSKKPPGGK